MSLKAIVLISCVLVIVSCGDGGSNRTAHSSRSRDTLLVHDTVYMSNQDAEWQRGFGLTHEPDKDSIWMKPVSYYLNDTNCNQIAADFYYGYFRPSDNGPTIELLKLACTSDNKLRPFYRWCLNQTLVVSDGALSELVGVPARKYAELFPDEFFGYLDKEKDNKYRLWTEAIQYSGFFDYPEYDNMDKLINEHYKRMSANLRNKSESNLERVRKFAKDCQSI